MSYFFSELKKRTTLKSTVEPNLSKRIYQLRRAGKIDEARQVAENLIKMGHADENVYEAYAWTLIDIAERHLNNGDEEAAKHISDKLNELSRDQFEPNMPDGEFKRNLLQRVRRMAISFTPDYSSIQEANDLSKNGNNDKALEIMSGLYKDGNLPEVAHVDYGWAIYRYLKDHYKERTSEEVRGLLRDYIVLKNERPSLLHFQILNFALNYSKEDENFKLPAFLKYWGPGNLRDEDYKDSTGNDGKKIPSLMDRIARVVVEYAQEDIQEFVNLLPDRKDDFIEMLKEQFFWKIYHSTEGNVSATTWTLFDQYLDFFPEAPACEAHSRVLGLAERVMKDDNTYRFYSFFKRWNPEKLKPADWIEEKGENDVVYKPLAIKCIKKAKEAITSLSDEQIGDLQWLIALYGVTVTKFPEDDWNIRSKALLHLKAGQLEDAKAIYRDLCLKMGEKYYIWQEFADCWEDNDIKIALLCKAISLEKNEDFIGKIRLELAKRLIVAGKKDNAAVEIKKYKEHYIKMGWRISADVNELQEKSRTFGPELANNEVLYSEYIPKAEDCAYAEIPYTSVVLVDSWKNDEGKEFMAFTDGDAIEFAINKRRFPVLRKSRTGQVWRMKLFKEETVKIIPSAGLWHREKREVTVKYTPLVVAASDMEDWGSLPVGYGYVQHVNEEKKVYHIYSTDSILVYEHYERKSLNIGDFVAFRQYKKKVKDEDKSFFCGIKKCDASEAIEKFKTRIVAVDDVNETKRLFHFVLGPKLISGLLHYDQTELRPSVGDCIKIHYFVRKIEDKKNPGQQKKVIEVIKSEATDEINGGLIKGISGFLELKYRDGYYGGEADFAFVGDYYVHKSLLLKYDIHSNCRVEGKAVYAGDGKWKVFEIEKN